MPAGRVVNNRDLNSSKSSLTSLEVRFATSSLSGSRRRLIREILDKHEETFFLSSREMAKYSIEKVLDMLISKTKFLSHPIQNSESVPLLNNSRLQLF